MAFKINISERTGKTFHLELEGGSLVGKQLHDKIDGKEILPDLIGYEFEITGASDKSGFTAVKEVEGIGLKKVLLSYEKAMRKKPRKEGKKKLSKNSPKGLRLRKTVRGRIISNAISQINLKVLKQGTKKLADVFPDQCKTAEVKASSETSGTKTEALKKETVPAEPETKSEPKPNEIKKVEEKKEEGELAYVYKSRPK